ncbi:MAG: acyloxyacyl hydrolase [Chelatococcus sp.]|nr:MAG: acyloxyacyl hydrolase [Chelatococcus sp.]
MVRVALSLLAGLLAASPLVARAQSLPAGVSNYAPATQSPSSAWEARFGAGFSNPGGREDGLANLGADLLTPRVATLDDRFAAMLVPRFNLGTSLNLNGTRFAYAGATWTFDLASNVFLEASLGAAVNDGKTGAIVPDNRLSLGCNTGARAAGALGFRLSDRWSVVTTLEHFSTAGCSDRTGNTPRGPANIGARLGYTF